VTTALVETGAELGVNVFGSSGSIEGDHDLPVYNVEDGVDDLSIVFSGVACMITAWRAGYNSPLPNTLPHGHGSTGVSVSAEVFSRVRLRRPRRVIGLGGPTLHAEGEATVAKTKGKMIVDTPVLPPPRTHAARRFRDNH
jgi:hypothetical protein